MNHSLVYVSTDQNLESLCANLLSQADKGPVILGLDTEFWREKTYWPELCLIQMCVKDQIFLVDAFSCDWKRLQSIISHPQIIKVMHASDQDCEIFHHYIQTLPVPLFDTQIAAKILGFQRQIGYGGLVTELLGYEIDKSNQHTNWRQRPLAQEQLNYASLDVLYLEQLYRILNQRLHEEGTLSTFEEQQQNMLLHMISLQDPGTIWKRWDNHRYNDKTRNCLKFLAQFREKAAQEKNIPRGYIFKDEALIIMTLSPPQTMKQLLKVRGIGRKFFNKEEFLKNLKEYL